MVLDELSNRNCISDYLKGNLMARAPDLAIDNLWDHMWEPLGRSLATSLIENMRLDISRKMRT